MPLTRERLRSQQEVSIDAPLEVVWDYAMDISKIPEFHPRVDTVDLISGAAQRAEGVEYQCAPRSRARRVKQTRLAGTRGTLDEH